MGKLSKFGVFTLLFVSSLTIMVGSIVAPSLGIIASSLNFQYAPSWIITLPSLGVVLFAPFVGPLLKRFGVYNLLLIGLVPYAIFGFSGAFIENSYLLIANRIALGAAAVVVQVAGTAFIAQLFTGEDRMKMIAWQGMAVELGGVVFLTIGGVLGEIYWQYPFYIYLIAVVCLILVVKTLPRTTDNQPIVVQDDNINNGSTSKIYTIALASLLAMMLFFIGFVTLPLYLPEYFNFTESDTGYLLAFVSVMAVITASQMPTMVKKIGNGTTIVLGFAFFSAGFLTLVVANNVGLLIMVAVFLGIGFGFTIPLLNHMMVEVSTLENQGRNLGLFSMAVFGGQFLSTFIQYVSNDYTSIYRVAFALALLIGLVFYILFKKLGVK